MPRISPFRIDLSAEEARELRRRAAKHTLPYVEVRRAKMILVAAEGMSNDAIAIRLRNAARNFSFLRRLALTLFRADTSRKMSLPRTRKTAAWNPHYLAHGLGLPPIDAPALQRWSTVLRCWRRAIRHSISIARSETRGPIRSCANSRRGAVRTRRAPMPNFGAHHTATRVQLRAEIQVLPLHPLLVWTSHLPSTATVHVGRDASVRKVRGDPEPMATS